MADKKTTKSKKGAVRSVHVQRIVRRFLYHLWVRRRLNKLYVKIASQNVRTAYLKEAALQYRDSYYTDQHIDAVCKAIELKSEYEYLKGKYFNA